MMKIIGHCGPSNGLHAEREIETLIQKANLRSLLRAQLGTTLYL